MSEVLKPVNSNEKREGFGKKVFIVIRVYRHGQRDKLGNLIDLGRDITKQSANESGLKEVGFNAVKAIGSNADAKLEGSVSYTKLTGSEVIDEPKQVGRALETAHIYAHEIAGDEQFNTRVNDILNYETLLNPRPYNHLDIYNANLPANFEELKGEERIEAAGKAQTAVVNYLVDLNTPEAIEYKKEIAGSFAHVVEHYEEMAPRLNNDSKVLIVAGTHGGLMEFLLQQAIVMEKDGKKTVGFSSLDEIGGEFSPSEGYDVIIETDDQKNIKDLIIRFDNPNRPQGNMSLDKDKLKELAAYYENLHHEL